MQDEIIKKLCSFNELLNTICKNIQRARYEKLIIELAIAYDGYQFDLPAFLDFRGRCGVLHFHERDLARSLILFADCESTEINQKISIATAFHYKSFDSVDEAVY
jgi:DNA-directed RNA polymerase